jgi:two-component system nitrate/nitrite response regulator NarL
MSKTRQDNIRLLLLDDHALFRESVARLLQSESGLEVVAHCGSSAEALQIIASKEIDIVLLDLDLGQERGADFLDRLRDTR